MNSSCQTSHHHWQQTSPSLKGSHPIQQWHHTWPTSTVTRTAISNHCPAWGLSQHCDGHLPLPRLAWGDWTVSVMTRHPSHALASPFQVIMIISVIFSENKPETWRINQRLFRQIHHGKKIHTCCVTHRITLCSGKSPISSPASRTPRLLADCLHNLFVGLCELTTASIAWHSKDTCHHATGKSDRISRTDCRSQTKYILVNYCTLTLSKKP